MEVNTKVIGGLLNNLDEIYHVLLGVNNFLKCVTSIMTKIVSERCGSSRAIRYGLFGFASEYLKRLIPFGSRR